MKCKHCKELGLRKQEHLLSMWSTLTDEMIYIPIDTATICHHHINEIRGRLEQLNETL
jgi:GTP cyclohydrolase I